MRRVRSHIQLIAVLCALCVAGQALATVVALGATASPAEKAAIDKELQEAIAKGKISTTGTQGSTGTESTGSEGFGSSGAFSNLTQKAEAEEEAAPESASTSTSTSSGLSSSLLVPVFVVGGLLLAGIAFFIVRDARSVAPVGDGLNAGSTQDRAAQMRKRRAKAKAARRQRKRNR
jgi:hypothetical protein